MNVEKSSCGLADAEPVRSRAAHERRPLQSAKRLMLTSCCMALPLILVGSVAWGTLLYLILT